MLNYNMVSESIGRVGNLSIPTQEFHKNLMNYELNLNE